MDMNFKLYCEILKNEILEFRVLWNVDDLNQSYIDFKTSIAHWNKQYTADMTMKELAIEWGKEYYSPATPETHDYWVRK